MANNVINRVWNQNRMVTIEDLKGMVFQAESGGHTFQISGVDDAGNIIALSGSVAGVFLRPDNTDVAITGSASGGVVSVTLPANCYDVPGRFGLTVFVTANGQKTAVYAAMGTVSRTSSGTVSPGTTADVVDLINQINAAVATIPASWTGLMADIAPTYSDAAVYPVGSYVYYNGDLYRCTTAITTAESWTAGHWTQAVLGNDVSDLKSALTSVNKQVRQNEAIYKNDLINWETLSVTASASDAYIIDGDKVKNQVTAGLNGVVIDTHPGDFFIGYAQVVRNGADHAIFFDDDDNLISSSLTGTGTARIEKFSLLTPVGATKLCVMTATPSFIGINKSSFTDIANQKSVQDYLITKIGAKINLLDKETLAPNTQVVDGVVGYDSTSTFATTIKPIAIAENTKYYFTVFDWPETNTNGYRFLINWYDNQMNYLSISGVNATVFKTVYGVKVKEVTSPASASYAILVPWATVLNYSELMFVEAVKFTGVYIEYDKLTASGGGTTNVNITNNNTIYSYEIDQDDLNEWLSDHSIIASDDEAIDWYYHSSYRRLANINQAYMNTLQMKRDLLVNFLSLNGSAVGNVFEDGSATNHDSSVAVGNNDEAFIVFLSNTTRIAADAPTSDTAIIRLCILDVSSDLATIKRTITVAERNATYDGITLIKGAGCPNCFIDKTDSNKLHILFCSMISGSDKYVYIHCIYNIDLETLGNYSVCKIRHNNQLIDMQPQAIRAAVNDPSMSALGDTSYLNFNSTIAYDSGTYSYYGAIGNQNFWTKPLILRSTDFVVWDFITIPDFSLDCNMLFECATAVFNNALYLAIRQMYRTPVGSNAKPINNRTNLLLARLNLVTFDVIEETFVPNDCARPYFFMKNSELYLVSSVYLRSTADIIKIDPQILTNSSLIQEISMRADYPWIAVKDNGKLFFGGSWSNRVWCSGAELGKYNDHESDKLTASAILGITIPDYSN